VKRASISIIIIILMVFQPVFQETAVSKTFPDRPPLPSPNPEEKQTYIVMVDKHLLNDIVQKIQRQYPSLKIKRVFRKVFSGVSVYGPRIEIEKLLKEPGVQQAEPAAVYKASLEGSVPFIGGDDVRGLFDANDKRLTGKGVKVGIIDTGIDYRHPDLRQNYKGGYDLVDGDDDPMETQSYEGESTIHGTHVAGIIAANGKFRGIAPGADIIAYRALGPGGFGTSEQVIAAIEKAIEDQVDIINLSLGNSVNGPDWPTSIALNKAVESGIIAVTSSGNSGPELWTVGSPGTASKAISVGASTPPMEIPHVQIGINDRNIPLTPLLGAKPWDFTRSQEIAYKGIGTKEDVKDVKDKIVLLERGKLTFTEKVMNAKEAGAKAVLIYNNMKGHFAGSLETEIDIPAASLSKEDGKLLKKQIQKGERFLQTVYLHEEDHLADFSSRGPVTSTWETKPDVVAPGVAIQSTVPDGYVALQGTSMAAPHVAGACALIKQAHPNWTPEQVKAALMNTAKKLIKPNGTPYSPYEQGAGRIQVKEAVQTETLLYPGSFTFGMLHKEHPRTEKTIKLTIDNQSNKRKKMTFSIPKRKRGLQWKLPASFYMNPGEKRKVNITLDITPSVIGNGIHNGTLTVYEDGRAIHLPYLYIIEEPNYPRVMGFQFEPGDHPGTYKYEMYLPGGADEMGIALYDPETFRFIKYLDWRRNVSRGLVTKEWSKEEIDLKGVYKALIFAKKGNREDTIEAMIQIEDSIVPPPP
jgi:minor extracellular serine protease Vpr